MNILAWMHPSRVMILIGIAIGAAGAPSVAEELLLRPTVRCRCKSKASISLSSIRNSWRVPSIIVPVTLEAYRLIWPNLVN